MAIRDPVYMKMCMDTVKCKEAFKTSDCDGSYLHLCCKYHGLVKKVPVDVLVDVACVVNRKTNVLRCADC